MRVRQRAGEEKSMHGFCEIPDPVVSVDENCFYLFVWSFPCASSGSTFNNSASIFHIFICFHSLLVISVWECCVSCTVKCSLKVQAHLIKNVSWCCNADGLRTPGLWLAANSAAGLAQAPTHPLIMATHCCSTHTNTHITYCRTGTIAHPIVRCLHKTKNSQGYIKWLNPIFFFF